MEHLMYRNLFSRIVVVQEGRDPLPCCDLRGIHMPAGRLLKHHQTQRRDWNMQMRWQRKDVAIASQCADAYVSLTREEDADCIEGVETFK